jgi:hypothetical protein
MKYLKISNKGLIDVRLISLMGGTTKAEDRFKLGEFGSGLKYTLAYLFRNNVDFKIFVGTEEVKVNIETEDINGDIFEIICINGHRTSVTTKMGKSWEAWMIVRELWSNALDEGEHERGITSAPSGEEGRTTFCIQITEAINEVMDKWDNYFIHNQEPLSQNDRFAIYAGGSTLRLYKQGILIHEDKSKPALFSYDIRDAQINELREFRGSATCEIVGALGSAGEKAIRYFLENVTEDVFEGKMDYNWFVRFGQQWKSCLGNAKIIHPEAVKTIKDRGLDLDLAGTIVVPKAVYKFLAKEFEGIGALRTADKVNEFFEIHDEAIMLRINSAQAILETCNYFIHPELKFVVGVFGDKRTLAQINIDQKEIYLSERLIDCGMLQLCAMLIEENEHFRTGFHDHTREFQQHFIDLYTKTLLDKHEVRL